MAEMDNLITNFEGMDTKIKIFNIGEIMEKRRIEQELKEVEYGLNANDYEIHNDKEIYKEFITESANQIKIYNELLGRYNMNYKNKESTSKIKIQLLEDEMNILKTSINKLNIDLKNKMETSDSLMALYKFSCGECMWNCHATLFGAYHTECPNCGNTENLFKEMVITVNNEKVKNPIKTRFKPKTDVTENADILKGVEKNLKSIKLKEDKNMSENKTYIVACTGAKCQRSYETNDSPESLIGTAAAQKHTRCRSCQRPTTHSEKASLKKISHYDR